MMGDNVFSLYNAYWKLFKNWTPKSVKKLSILPEIVGPMDFFKEIVHTIYQNYSRKLSVEILNLIPK